MTNDIDSKIAKMQELMAHQAKEISDLNEVVTTQADEIDALKKYIKLKLDKIENSLLDLGQENHESVADEAAANKPPHY